MSTAEEQLQRRLDAVVMVVEAGVLPAIAAAMATISEAIEVVPRAGRELLCRAQGSLDAASVGLSAGVLGWTAASAADQSAPRPTRPAA